jgi:hypothetical protein
MQILAGVGSAAELLAEYLVIAGGGGGGTNIVLSTYGGAGGGGAGGYRTGTNFSLPASFTVTVGAGGGGNTNGSNSVFDSITSTGGGAGGAYAGDAGSSGLIIIPAILFALFAKPAKADTLGEWTYSQSCPTSGSIEVIDNTIILHGPDQGGCAGLLIG